MTMATLKMTGNLGKWINTLEKNHKKELKSIFLKSHGMAITHIKTTYPKMSGTARKAFVGTRLSDTAYKISNSLTYVKELEEGAPARTITPKRGKYLLFTVKKEKRTMSGLIKEGAKRRFFARLSMAKSQDRYSVMVSEGIFLSKKVNQKARKGKFLLKNLYAPKISKSLTRNIINMIRRIY